MKFIFLLSLIAILFLSGCIFFDQPNSQNTNDQNNYNNLENKLINKTNDLNESKDISSNFSKVEDKPKPPSLEDLEFISSQGLEDFVDDVSDLDFEPN